MFNLLFTLIFYLINFIANTFLAPILFVLNIFSGSQISVTRAQVVSAIFDFLNIVTRYILFASDILCIPRTLFIFVFTIVSALAVFVIGLRILVFGLAIYRHFKP